MTTLDSPKGPIRKAIVPPRAIAPLAVAEYRDELPAERQVRSYLRHGVLIAPTTMGDGLASSAEQLVDERQ